MQFKYLHQDLGRWKVQRTRVLFYMVFEPAVWATVFYRISSALYLIQIPVLKIFFRSSASILFRFSEVLMGVAIPASCKIGPGLFISHSGCVRIHHDCGIGEKFGIGPGNIIGHKELRSPGIPSIGSNVLIGLAAKLLGNVPVGNHVVIGANATIVRDLSDDALAGGVPAVVIRKFD